MTAPTTQEELQIPSGGGDIYVRWLMPEEFWEIPLTVEDLDHTAELLLELAQEVLPSADTELQVEWAAMCAANYDHFLYAGIEYAGFCLVEVDGARCTATVAVSKFDLDNPDSKRPVELLAATLRNLDIGEVSEIELPCGPAVSCIGNRQGSVDGALTQSGVDEPVWTSFIQVQVPLTNGTVIVMEMSTPTSEGWDTFSKMFAGIVRGIRLFDASGTPIVMAK
ncbi:hypothetical protein [Streptomyces sp. 7N604]|uniref:hypothetical protein n=1 Tax=Streptomyces sp. 7N604 TaxID=3457415 RepID=UPI003FD51DBF